MAAVLDQIDQPSDLKALSVPDLQAVAESLRQFVLHSVASTGGHLSANLGTVELAVALHHVFDTPDDRLIWDVGHQAYPHKILTGRRDRMAGLRQSGGISGFPSRAESNYDAFGTAHSSTSISAALGMAKAAQLRGESRKVVAVIGDGALSAGMAFEAMNNAGVSGTDVLIILNDNHMSISPPAGVLSDYLRDLMQGKFYAQTGHAASNTPLFGVAQQMERETQGWSDPDTLFAKFGLSYHGPIDGHDLEVLVPKLQALRLAKGPQFLHVVTRKGKGYARAEHDPIAYHGPGKFDVSQGLAASGASKPAKPTYTQVFGQWLCDMAQHDERLVGITPAMREGSGMVAFSQQFPQRYVDVGIAEQHAVTYAAGLACEGMKPVVAIYSTFLQRAYDQLIHDVALQNLPVLFALDRAGIVGADGATHAGVYDIPYLRCIPQVSIACPADENECRELLTVGYAQDHAVAVRYPRGSGPGVPVDTSLADLAEAKARIGQAQVRREGQGVLLLVFGALLHEALKAAETLNATVINMRWVKPLDEAMLHRYLPTHARVVTLEEGAIEGGAGSAVMQWLQAHHYQHAALALGLPDEFTPHGDPAQLLKAYGLDATGIVQSIQQHWPV
jgi:1-deoxy-D-xylulose-5-phosphate synthase